MSVKNLTFVNNNPPPCDDEFLNSTKNEINNNITSSGQSLTGIGDTQQLAKSSANYAASGAFYSCTNTGDAYTLTPVSPFQGITGYKDGQLFRFRPSATNTTQSPTVNVNGQGVKNITKADGTTQVEIGQIDSNEDVELRYDIGNDVLVLPKLGTTSLIPTLYIGGLNTENDIGDTDHDIKFNIGSCRDKADTFDIRLTAPLVKQIDAVWTAGTGVGGRASAVSLTANTTFHKFVISKIDGTTDAGFDTSLTATNLLADATGYTKYRRVGSIKTDSSANIPLYNQFKNRFKLSVPINDFTGAVHTSAVLRALSMPTGIIARALFSVGIRANVPGNTAIFGLVTNPTQADTTPSVSLYNVSAYDGNNEVEHNATFFDEETDTSAQIRFRFNALGSSVNYEVMFFGWEDLFID